MKHIVISGISLFYMSIWLAIFQELFEKDVSSSSMLVCIVATY